MNGGYASGSRQAQFRGRKWLMCDTHLSGCLSGSRIPKMPATLSRSRRCSPWIAALLLGSALGGCNGTGGPDAAPSDSGSADADAAPVTLPLSTTGPTTQMTAPPVTALPAGQAVGLRRLANRQQGYGWLDQANYQEDAVEDAPPDYSFDQGGVQPWTWATGDGGRVISEPVAGGYRTYFYADGSQQPYLVRDPSYSYAYDNGALVAVFTLAGVLSDPVAGSAQAMYGARYFDRGRGLWHEANSGPHLPVNAYAWSDRRADLAAQRVSWQAHVADNPDWSAWNGAHAAAERSRWDDVRAQHQAAAQQFGTWQQQKFQGPPPQLYAPPARPEEARPEPARPDHSAAVAGGVVAAGAAAVAAHAVIAHQAAQRQAGATPAARQPTMPPAQHQTGGPAHTRWAPGMVAHPQQRPAAQAARPEPSPMANHAPVNHATFNHAPAQAMERQAPRPVAEPQRSAPREVIHAPAPEQARSHPAPPHAAPQHAAPQHPAPQHPAPHEAAPHAAPAEHAHDH
jgi:hypothetical protein